MRAFVVSTTIILFVSFSFGEQTSQGGGVLIFKNGKVMPFTSEGDSSNRTLPTSQGPNKITNEKPDYIILDRVATPIDKAPNARDLLLKAQDSGLNLIENPSDFRDPRVVEFFLSLVEAYNRAKAAPEIIDPGALAIIGFRIGQVQVHSLREDPSEVLNDEVGKYVAKRDAAGIGVYRIFEGLDQKERTATALHSILQVCGLPNLAVREAVYLIFYKKRK